MEWSSFLNKDYNNLIMNNDLFSSYLDHYCNNNFPDLLFNNTFN